MLTGGILVPAIDVNFSVFLSLKCRNLERPLTAASRLPRGEGTVTSGTTKQEQEAENTRPGKPGLIEWLQTVPGIITAVAGLLAAVGAFYGGAQLSGGRPQPTVTVTARAAGATVTVPAAAATVTVTAGPVPTISGTALPPGARYLTSLTPLLDTEPDNTQGITVAPQEIGATAYTQSVRFTCGDKPSFNVSLASSLVYEVAGYRALEVTIGVPSNAANALGNSATIQFLKDGGSTQLIPQVTVTLDQPQTVTIPLSGTSQLDISCIAANQGGEDVVLANAALVR